MLVSLELFGFKSFAERTSFEFDPGVTAVVGPNGSGKSNVVDAIKWVLGDQSAKSLRGKEMTDVIFNGAAGRAPGNFAEATLTFDNTQGFLPMGDRFVRVGRRLWRNGDSEYLLDGQTARLKDVRDLFMGTGAGTSAYAIIEQGRVDQILRANAIGRRAVFEEAAGIGRYQAKKAEALRRLERVDQNLLRLTDIVDEVEARLHATRTQAAKAAAHRDVSRELEQTWLGMAADDYRQNAAARANLDATLAAGQSRDAACRAECDALRERTATIDAALSEAEQSLRSTEQAAATAREAIAGEEATRRYQSARLEELSHDLARLRRQAMVLARRVADGQREQSHTQMLLDRATGDLAAMRERLESREARLAQFTLELNQQRREIDALRDEHLARMRSAAETESRQAALWAERDSLLAAIQTAESRIETVSAELAERDEALAREAKSADEAEARLRLRQESAADLRGAREQLARQRETLAASLAALRERISATVARIGVLEDMQRRGEGFGIGVREILRRARSLREAPWNQIYGTVADLLDVDLDDAPLLEIALGDRAQLVVIENFDALLPYLGRSSAQIAGRVGFFSKKGLPQHGPAGGLADDLSGVRYIEAQPVRRESVPGGRFSEEEPQTGRSGQLDGLPGVLKRADELIRASSRMPQLAKRLLDDTWIVNDLNTALRLAAGHGRGLRFVTESGELLDADGTLVVGTLRAEAAVVSRRSELMRLRAERTELDRAIAQAAGQQAELDQSQASLAETLASADADLREATDRLGQARASLARAEDQRAQCEQTRQRLNADLAGKRKAESELEERRRQSRRDLAAAQEEVDRLGASLDQAQQRLGETDQRQCECEEAFAAERLELAKAEERLEGLRDTAERLGRDAQQRAGQLGEAVRRLDAALAGRSETTCHLLNAQAIHAEAYWARDQHEAVLHQAAARRDEQRQKRRSLAARESELLAERAKIGETIHQAELTIREQDQKIAALADRIREEYDRELAELAESEHSAIALWAEQRRAGDEGTGGRGDGETLNPQPSTLIPQPSYNEIRPEIEARVERLRKKLRMMGAVDDESLADLDELEQRHADLSGQLQDLVEAKRMLEDVIRRINAESKRMFLETFESIRGHFQTLFRKLFGGGEGDIILEDAGDVLECGIEIVARPPGKELRSLSLLSGGEKTMTCVGMLLAIFRSNPSPFCLLDEVDAALDEANIGRFVSVLADFKSTTQFIMITHRKPSMCEADVLYGVTMEQAGVSKRLNVRFEEIAEDGHFKTPRRRAA